MLFTDALYVIQKHAFASSEFPLILTIENHCSEENQVVQAKALKDILGEYLFAPTSANSRDAKISNQSGQDDAGVDISRLSEYEGNAGWFRSPRDLIGKILVRHKLRAMPKVQTPNAASVEKDSKKLMRATENKEKAKAILTRLVKEELLTPQDVSPKKSEKVKSIAERNVSPKQTPKNSTSSINTFLESSFKYLRQMPFVKRQRKGVKATAEELARLVYIKNMKVKNKTIDKFAASDVPISCSWDEGKLKRTLKDERGRFRVRLYTGKQIMRVYPAYWRIDSSNFGPQRSWAVGVQMVAMNYQNYDKGMSYQYAKFRDNGGCGYILKPSWIRDKNNDPDMLKLISPQ